MWICKLEWKSGHGLDDSYLIMILMSWVNTNVLCPVEPIVLSVALEGMRGPSVLAGWECRSAGLSLFSSLWNAGSFVFVARLCGVVHRMIDCLSVEGRIRWTQDSGS